MKLTAWTWLIFGTIITVMSGYIYLFVPKNGQHNAAMALFFFIGIVFIIIGVVKLMFKRVDDKEVFDSAEQAIQTKKEEIIRIPVTENRVNRVDEAINQMANKHTHTGNQPVQQQPHQAHHSNHTNTYYQIHQYKGPVHTASTGTHAQHPVSQHTHPAAHHTQNVQNTADHGIRCHKCGNVNSGHSNYCHQCGNRLK